MHLRGGSPLVKPRLDYDTTIAVHSRIQSRLKTLRASLTPVDAERIINNPEESRRGACHSAP